MKILRWRCGNNSNGGNDLQKPWNSRDATFAFPRPSLPFVFTLDVLSGSFLYTSPRTTTSLRSSPPLLHCMRFLFQTIAHLPHHLLFGTISYSTFNDLLQSSFFPYRSSLLPRTLATLFFLITLPFSTYVTLSSRSAIYLSFAGTFCSHSYRPLTLPFWHSLGR